MNEEQKQKEQTAIEVVLTENHKLQSTVESLQKDLAQAKEDLTYLVANSFKRTGVDGAEYEEMTHDIKKRLFR